MTLASILKSSGERPTRRRSVYLFCRRELIISALKYKAVDIISKAPENVWRTLLMAKDPREISFADEKQQMSVKAIIDVICYKRTDISRVFDGQKERFLMIEPASPSFREICSSISY